MTAYTPSKLHAWFTGLRNLTDASRFGGHIPSFGGSVLPHVYCYMLAALEALESAQNVSSELYHMISEVKIWSGHDMVLYTAEGGVPIIFGRGESAKKMVKLDAFWKKFITEQGPQDIRYIDLRFEDQVIVSSITKKSS